MNVKHNAIDVKWNTHTAASNLSGGIFNLFATYQYPNVSRARKMKITNTIKIKKNCENTFVAPSTDFFPISTLKNRCSAFERELEKNANIPVKPPTTLYMP